MKLQLPNVTLVCIDTICHDLTAIAVKNCVDKVRFGGIHIHTNDDSAFRRHLGDDTDGADEVIELHKVKPFLSLYEVMNYLWYGAPQRIETEFMLFVQWDSGIVDPAMWDERFLQYDYIGAPWGWHGDDKEVGNGGFSLRSARLMRFLNKHHAAFPMLNPEDDTLCRSYRPHLEDSGFYFAPIDVASKFSFERTGYNAGKHFGYHGVFNWPYVFTEQEMTERMGLLMKNEYTNQDKHLGELLNVINRQKSGAEFRAASAITMNYNDLRDLIRAVDGARQSQPERKLDPVHVSSYGKDGSVKFRLVHDGTTNQVIIQEAA